MLADIAPAQREARLGKLGLNPFLAARLRAMLTAQAGEGILDGTLAISGDEGLAPYASLAAGTVVGNFRVERLIGRGGMGEVYLAHRDGADFDQRVALKLLRPEAAERFGSFSSERRLLAGLEHSGIARLIDGGVAADGRPYMAMDFVEGEEIDRWCATHHADLATRLRLFLEVCDAVTHAHARLVIHRDLKPVNILVDGTGHARLLDFGVARLLDLDDSERAATEALLTPQYAAPEQFSGGAMTVATDVYALGAVLYQLLAGHGPWQGNGQQDMPTVLRRLLNDDPPAPSKTTNNPDVSSQRIEGDLDAIVLKAMRHDPQVRYSSVEALAADIRRYLEHRPVQARSGADTAPRPARRRLSPPSWPRRAAQQRDLAVAEAERTEAVNQAMMLMFRDANDEGRTDSITARELIDNTARRLVASLAPQSPKSAAIVSALSDLYLLTEDLPASQALLEGALAQHIGMGDAVGTAQMKLRLAQAYGATKRFPEARRLLADASRVWATDPGRYGVERVEAASAEAYMLRLEGKPEKGIALLQATMPEAESAYGPNSRDLATRYANLATHLVMANRLKEASATIAKGERVMARGGLAQSPAALTMLELKGSIAARNGDLAAAESTYRNVAAQRRALYGRSYSLAVDLLQDGRALNQLGRPAEGLRAFDEAKPMAAEYLGVKAQPTLLAGLGRAESLTMLGRTDEAHRALAEVETDLTAQGPTTTDFGSLCLVRGALALKEGRLNDSRRELALARIAFRSAGPGAAGYDRSARALASAIDAHRGPKAQ